MFSTSDISDNISLNVAKIVRDYLLHISLKPKQYTFLSSSDIKNVLYVFAEFVSFI